MVWPRRTGSLVDFLIRLWPEGVTVEAVVLVLLIAAAFWWRRRKRRSAPSVPVRPRRSPAATMRSAPTQASKATPKISPLIKERSSVSRRSVWVPPGKSVSVQGLELPGGMLYVGEMLPAARTRGTPDPALINPRLPINRLLPDWTGEKMGYWPSYSEIDPTCRAAYLEWLNRGRPAGAYIGYVFLFFYGIERRVLIDARRDPEARAEVPLLLAEVERLLELYGLNNSFRGYASSFLAIARVLDGVPDPETFVPPTTRTGWEVPLDVKLALATFVDRGQAIPAEWAFAWMVTHPETRLRTPATRCPDEFRELFMRRYVERFGDGLKLARNKTRLKLAYRPASASFGQPIDAPVGNLPDVTRLTAPVAKLRQLADEVQEELSGFSRWVGRTHDRTSLAALSHLPVELVTSSIESNALQTWLDEQLGSEEMAVVPTAQLLGHWPVATPGRFTKLDATMYASLLERIGYGIEPDVRFGGPNPSKSSNVVVFRLDGETITEPTSAYRAVSLLLHLGVAVAAADGESSHAETQQLEHYINDAPHLTAAERDRLRAHLHWLLVTSPGVAGLRQRCDALDPLQRQQLGQFVISVAGADGRLDPDEIKTLERIYRLLGLDPDNLYRDLHGLAAASSGPATDPVVILPPSSDTPGFVVPAPPASQPSSVVTLAPDRLAAIMAETRTVASLLESVFADEDPDPAPVAVGPVDGPPVATLDEAHSSLVHAVAARAVWPRGDFDDLADRLGLLPAGAIETVNEAAFDLVGEPFFEGEDPIEVNNVVFEEWLA